MSGIAFVRSNQVIEIGGGTYLWPATPDGVSRDIPVTGTEPVGVFWKKPIIKSTNIVGYKDIAVDPAAPSTKPTPDCVKMLRLKILDNNEVIGIAITDTDETSSASPQSQWSYLSNGTGGTLPVMPTVTIPYPIFQNPPVSSTATTNTFLFVFPPNAPANKYKIPAAWFNGVLGTAFVPGAITTVAGIVTWANTNWSDYGTWSVVNTNILKLVSATSNTVFVENAGFTGSGLTATARTLVMTVVNTPAAVNGVGFGGGVPIPFPAFMAANTTASKQALINAVAHIYQSNQVTMALSGANDITVTTTLGQCIIYNDTTPVITST